MKERLLKNNFKSVDIIKLVCSIILIFFVIVPLIFILVELKDVNFAEVVSSEKFLSALGNSVLVSIVTTIIAILFAFVLSYLLANTTCRFKGIFSVLITIPMLIPSISHGMGLTILLGDNGLLTNLLGLKVNIYGFTGVMLGSFMYSFPVAFLMFNDIFRYEDRSVYDVADIMGIPKYRQFLDITLPYIAKPLISIFFAVFTMIFTDYGVSMMVGGRFVTLPLYMYNEVIGQLNFGVGAIISLVLIIPAIIALIIDIKYKGSDDNSSRKQYMIRSTKLKNIVCYVLCGLALFFVLLPIVSFCFIGFINKFPIDNTFGVLNFKKLLDMNVLQYLGNSIIIAILVGMLGTILSYGMAYLTSRTKSNLMNKVMHILSMLSLAIPGIVLGISYSLMYGGSDFANSLFILIIINILHFFSSPYIMAYNAFNKVNKNYEIVSETLHINKFRYIIDILIPDTSDTMMEMFSYYFVNSMVTISAVSFLANTNTNPLSLLINQLEGQMLIECVAIVSMIILIINCAVKLLVYILKRFRGKKYAR